MTGIEGFFELRRLLEAKGKKKPRSCPGTLHVAKNKVAAPPAAVTLQSTVKDEVFMKKPSEATYKNLEKEIDGRHQVGTQWGSVPEVKSVLKHNVSENKPPSYRGETIQNLERNNISHQRSEHKTTIHDFEKNASNKDAAKIGTSSRGSRLESVGSQHKGDRQRQNPMPERYLPNIAPQQKPTPRPTTNGLNLSSSLNNELPEDTPIKSIRKDPFDVTDGPKT